jgi:uncharacterized protein (DUF488 family)
MKILTIGHGNHPLNKFIQLLDENGVLLLVDVRTSPASRFNPQYNKENLERELP